MPNIIQACIITDCRTIGLLAVIQNIISILISSSQDKEDNKEMKDIIDTSKTCTDVAPVSTKPGNSVSQERIDYVGTLLHQFQVIFGHLVKSKLQYYVPKEFWKHFRLDFFLLTRNGKWYGNCSVEFYLINLESI